MEKIVKEYNRPQVKVNNFISRNHYLSGWEIEQGTTNQQLGYEPGPDDMFDPDIRSRESRNVWEDE